MKKPQALKHTPADVERTLDKENCSIEDFKALPVLSDFRKDALASALHDVLVYEDVNRKMQS